MTNLYMLTRQTKQTNAVETRNLEDKRDLQVAICSWVTGWGILAQLAVHERRVSSDPPAWPYIEYRLLFQHEAQLVSRKQQLALYQLISQKRPRIQARHVCSYQRMKRGKLKILIITTSPIKFQNSRQVHREVAPLSLFYSIHLAWLLEFGLWSNK